MEFKALYDGTKIPVLGLGTWLIGGGVEADHSKDAKEVEAIRAAVQMGYTHIDTAEMYGAGHTEELVGSAVKGVDRESLFITSKVMDAHLHYDDVIAAAKKSLARLRTSYLDLYLVHKPNPAIPIEETMRAMDYLVEQKLVRFIGVSNFSLELLKEAEGHAENKIAANQIEYSLLTRDTGKYGNNTGMESRTIPYCQKNGIIVVAERPVERGVLLQPNPVMDKLAEKYGKTRAQIAINWLISKKNVVTIPKSSSVEHLKENLGALGWRMDDEDERLLDKTRFTGP
jgi:diketogulonate reductase-like aldo/keto reductase